jgi:cytosine/adenosine deaminase-related metal-dependent hydrolase
MRRGVWRASWVLPIAAPPIANGAVAVEDGRIAWVGPAAEAPAGGGASIDLGEGVLMPGTVNAHCHLELSHLAGRLPADRGFVGWIEAVVQQRGQSSRDEVRERAGAGIRALESCGTAAVGDVSNALDHLDLLERSRLQAVVFHELIAWDPARAEEVVRAAIARVAEAGARLNGRVRVRLAAHAPYSVSGALFEALRAQAGPASVHLAESPDESAFVAAGAGELKGFLERRGVGHVAFSGTGTTPVQYLDRLGLLSPSLLAVHCVQLDEEDRATLARRAVHAVLCPRSNRRLGVGLPRLPELVAAGVRLALGTDSLASADSLDVLDDAALLHRAYPDVASDVLVRMATAGGAEALGFDDLGTLAPGKRAALAFAPAPAVRDPYAFLVSGHARLQAVAA